MSTGYNCTRCGKEFEIGETAIALDVGTIEELPIWEEVSFSSNDGAWEELLCSDCHNEILRVECHSYLGPGVRCPICGEEGPKPNRVVVEVRVGMVDAVYAERPTEVVVIIRDHDGVQVGEGIGTDVFGINGTPIKQLNTVKEL